MKRISLILIVVLASTGCLRKTLDHFRFYEVQYEYETIPGLTDRMKLRGQLDTAAVPVFFAVPVSKRVRNKEYPIKSEPHLTIYKLSETTVPEPRELFEIKNQFQDERRYKTVKSFYLAVPTEKTDKTRTKLPPPHQD